MKRITGLIDSVTTPRIITVWTSGVIGFGLLYYIGTYTGNPLLINGGPLTTDVNGLGNALYYSFMTAATIGSNITAIGLSKFLSVAESLFSIAAFSALIARIVHVQQEELKSEVEELSFEEHANNSTTQMYIFRNDIKHIQEKLESSKAKKFDTKEFDNATQSMTNALASIQQSLSMPSHNPEHFALRTELMLNSLNISLSRMVELLEQFNNKKIDWKKESTTTILQKSQNISDATMVRSYQSNSKIGEKLEDLSKTIAKLQGSFQKR